MSLIGEVTLTWAIFSLWAAAFSISAAPFHAFNLTPFAAGSVAAYIGYWTALGTGSVSATILASALVGSLFSLAAHIILIRPLAKRVSASRAILIATLGLIGLTEAALSLSGSSEVISLRAVRAIRSAITGMLQGRSVILLGLGTVLLLLLLSHSIRRSNMGRFFDAVSANRDAAVFYHLPVRAVDLYAASISGGMAGYAGFLVLASRATAPHHLFQYVLWGATGATLGGLRSPTAAAVGGVLIGSLEMVVLRFSSSAMKDLIIGAVFMAVLLWRPDGILTQRSRRRQ